MKKLNKREMTQHPCCCFCKHCVLLEGEDHYNEMTDSSRLCMLDVSEKDIEYIEDEIIEKGFYGTDYSDKLLKIVGIKESRDIFVNSRSVYATDCCQFYEKE